MATPIRLEPSAAATPPLAAPVDQLTAQACEELPSRENARTSFIYFLNMSGEQRRVYWLNYDGQRRLYRTLETLQFYLQPTYLDARWVVTDASDACIATFLSAESSVSAVLRSASGALPELPAHTCEEEPALQSRTGRPPATVVEFVNASNTPVRVYWKNFAGVRTFYQTVPTGARFAEPTFETHVWVVTDSSDVCRTVFVSGSTPATATIR